MSPPLRDRQQDEPTAYCALCEQEQYAYDKLSRQDGLTLCPLCAAGEGETHASLSGLSTQYRNQAQALRGRMRELESLRGASRSKRERESLRYRTTCLSELWREARDLAVLTERYYDRGYRRNGKYSL